MHSSTSFPSELCIEPSFVRTCDTVFAWACCFSRRRLSFVLPLLCALPSLVFSPLLLSAIACLAVSTLLSVFSGGCFGLVRRYGLVLQDHSSMLPLRPFQIASSACSILELLVLFAFPTSHHCCISLPVFAFCHSFTHAFVTMTFRGYSFSTLTLHFQYPGPLAEYSIGNVSATG